MDTLSFKTQSANNQSVKRDWYIVDAEDQIVGRLCSQIAHILRGKNKPYYTPHVDCGDHVIVINASKVKFSGNKWIAKKYVSYSGYPGGQKVVNPKTLNQKQPEAIIENAVRGMLPKNKLGRAMFKKLFVYSDADHPHHAQNPKQLNFNK